MQALLQPLRELAEFSEIQSDIRKKSGIISVSGCVDSQKLHMIYGLSEGVRHKIIVTYSDLRAKEIYEEYKFYDRNVLLYPAKDLIFFQADIHGNQLTRERIRVLRRLAEGKPMTVVTTFAALMTPQVVWDVKKDILTIEKGGIIDEGELAKRLVALGYEKVYQVESGGQFSIRGDIVDIFDAHGIETEIISASIRNPLHVTEAAKLGAHIATVPYKVIMQMIKHPLTDAGIEKFLKDWEGHTNK